MPHIWSNFHFLRPLWFLALPPTLALLVVLGWSRFKGSGWDKAINPALLPHLLDSLPGRQRRWPLVWLLVAWLLATLGLAGPVWQKLPQPVRQKEDALVLIQDLSLSFYAQDLSPNRLTRARHKLIDILRARKEGLTGLIVYAGDAHVVSPLTDDTNTIAAMVPELDPGIMPSYGSNLSAAVELARKLLHDTGLNRGRLLLLTDEVEPTEAAAVGKILSGQRVTLSVLGVGTQEGGPIPKGDGGFLQDDQGRIVVPRLSPDVLRALAADNGGRYSDLRIDDADFHSLLDQGASLPRDDEYRQTERQFDQWQEQGHWLALLLIPLALVAFRRGWLLSIFLLFLLLQPARECSAMEWRDLWLRQDQQAAQALAANDAKGAAELFQSQPWKGVAEYRAGNYGEAAAAFAAGDSADDNYNRGNGLAKAGQLQEALAAYDQALRLNPGMADGAFNREQVEKALKQQKNQQQGTQSGQQQQPGQPGQQNQAGKPGPQGQQEQSGKPGEPGEPGEPGQAGQPGQQNQSRQANQSGQPGQSQSAQADQGKQSDRSHAGEQSHGAEQTDRKGDQTGRSASGTEQKGSEGRIGEKKPGEPGKDGKDAALERLTPEQRQALEQTLRQIPDDPGGLLRRKFEYQYQNNQGRNPGANRKIW